MAIETKFNLVSENELSKRTKYSGAEYRISLVVSSTLPKGKIERIPTYTLHFPREVVFVYDLLGKKIKFYCDKEKKCIFWRIMDEKTTLEEFESTRLVKVNKAGQWVVSVAKMINAMELDLIKTRSMIPVKKYSSPGYLYGADFWYINLKKDNQE